MSTLTAEPTTGTALAVVCNRGELADALASVAAVIPTRTPKPILQCVRLEATTDELSIAANSLEISASCICRIVSTESAGVACVSAAQLLAVVREVPDDTVKLELSGERLTVTGQQDRHTLNALDPKDWPPVAEWPDAPAVTLPAPTLKRLLAQTSFARSDQTTRGVMQGTLLTAEKNEMRAVALDERKLAMGTAPVVGKLQQVVAPPKIIDVLMKMLPDAAGDETPADVEIAANDRLVAFRCDDWALIGNLLEGQFPPYQSIISQETDRALRIEREAAVSAFRRARLGLSEVSRAIRCKFTKGGGTLQSRSPEKGESAVQLQAEYSGEPIEIGFNPDFLIQAFQAADGEAVELQMSAPNRPGVIRCGQFLCVLMPVNLA